ncbi:hypothetical protein AMTR_s00103p00151220 [Amborella trichopoda]|uniref:Uncharacterized protein n=1 Tax=Amborella trichopoda TaxID=13333 RepID=W1NZ34_AMBTC|nr:hypothetical protein AMTR_s00103p00151220 [Amborella trichopoda]
MVENGGVRDLQWRAGLYVRSITFKAKRIEPRNNRQYLTILGAGELTVESGGALGLHWWAGLYVRNITLKAKNEARKNHFQSP